MEPKKIPCNMHYLWAVDNLYFKSYHSLEDRLELIGVTTRVKIGDLPKDSRFSKVVIYKVSRVVDFYPNPDVIRYQLD